VLFLRRQWERAFGRNGADPSVNAATLPAAVLLRMALSGLLLGGIGLWLSGCSSYEEYAYNEHLNALEQEYRDGHNPTEYRDRLDALNAAHEAYLANEEQNRRWEEQQEEFRRQRERAEKEAKKRNERRRRAEQNRNR